MAAKGQTTFNEFQAVLATRTSNLYHHAMREPDLLREVRYRHDGAGNWFIIVKGYLDDGGPGILFGHATSFIEALTATNAMLATKNWKRDIPWSERNGG